MKRATLPLILGLMFLLSACTSIETNAYRTIGMTQVAAKGAIEGWRDYVATGKATQADENAVRLLWIKYQEAIAIAEAAQKTYAVTKDIAQLNAGTSVLTDTGQELVNFIYGYIPKPVAKKGK